ncbi:hypothetical protein AB0K18_10710 [Nonomuraea sp. NPDC049421]|uniref:hypothetical protein n=1 Tax=Nonomuraea sp. NPDC049421 TaxID=3155275 RepID=UPI00343859DD
MGLTTPPPPYDVAEIFPELPFPPGTDLCQVLRVREYPIEELPDELYEKIEKSALIGADLYEDQLSVAPGTKVGGWIPWVQAPETVTCRHGHEMEHLLTIASWEHDPGAAPRWAPLEERHLLSSDFDPEQLGPSGLMIGDAGDAHLFVCLECPDRPVGSAAQWS